MALSSTQYEWKTDSLTQFTAAIAQNAGTNLDLAMTTPNPVALAGIGGDCRGQLRSLSIASVENLAWEVWLWSSTTHGTAALSTVAMIGRWTFVAADGVRIAGTGDYYYYVDGLDVPVWDADKTGKLHLTLVNRSAASKSADAAGAIVIKGRIAPLGY